MDDKEAILFVNDTVMPLAEKIRALRAELDSVRSRWYGGINLKAQDNDAVIEHGRTGEGVGTKTCGDLNTFMSQVLKTAPGEPGEWNAQIIEKFCVRGFKA